MTCSFVSSMWKIIFVTVAFFLEQPAVGLVFHAERASQQPLVSGLASTTSSTLQRLPNRIVMMMTEGCSGSSFIYRVLSDLIQLHGVQVWSPHKEFLVNRDIGAHIGATVPYCRKPDGTQLFWPENATERVAAVWSVLSHSRKCRNIDVEKPTIFLFDGHKPHLMLEVLPFMSRLGRRHSRIFGLSREHRLERLICTVKDCFRSDKNSYPVTTDGAKSDMCFERREPPGHHEAHVKVVLEPAKIKDMLALLGPVWEREDMRAQLSDHDFKRFPSSTFEELTEYEYSSEKKALSSSTDSYCKLLQGMGIASDRQTVRGYLRSHGFGTRKQQKVKNDIFNVNSVEKALKGTQYASELELVARFDRLHA